MVDYMVRYCMIQITNHINNCYYINTWKGGSNITSTPTENSTFTTNSSTIYSKTAAEMQASSFVSSTGAAGTTLNLSTTVVSGATAYKARLCFCN
jgi:hypothetical protein